MPFNTLIGLLQGFLPTALEVEIVPGAAAAAPQSMYPSSHPLAQQLITPLPSCCPAPIVHPLTRVYSKPCGDLISPGIMSMTLKRLRQQCLRRQESRIS
ncbi:hypothetical protein VTI28DRAFT_6244 [Corynascus sepedonium]